MASNYSAAQIPDERAVCQYQEQKIFDKDLGATLSVCINEIGVRLSCMSTALSNLYRTIYIGGEYEENPGFHPEVENSIAASVVEIYKVLSECEARMDNIFKKL